MLRQLRGGRWRELEVGAPPERLLVELHPRPPKATGIRVRDPADRWILATAVAAAADVLVTGDRDLLDAAKDSPVRIVTPRQLWSLLQAGRPPS